MVYVLLSIQGLSFFFVGSSVEPKMGCVSVVPNFTSPQGLYPNQQGTGIVFSDAFSFSFGVSGSAAASTTTAVGLQPPAESTLQPMASVGQVAWPPFAERSCTSALALYEDPMRQAPQGAQ